MTTPKAAEPPTPEEKAGAPDVAISRHVNEIAAYILWSIDCGDDPVPVGEPGTAEKWRDDLTLRTTYRNTAKLLFEGLQLHGVKVTGGRAASIKTALHEIYTIPERPAYDLDKEYT